MEKLKAQVARLERQAALNEEDLERNASLKQELAKSQATVAQLKKEVGEVRLVAEVALEEKNRVFVDSSRTASTATAERDAATTQVRRPAAPPPLRGGGGARRVPRGFC